MKFVIILLNIYIITTTELKMLRHKKKTLIKNDDLKYEQIKKFWANSESSVSGVLYGYTETNIPDIKSSNELMKDLIQNKIINSNRAIDCCAGVGRVTSNVLMNYFQEIDIMEQDEKYIQKCKSDFSSNPKVKNVYQSTLQDFKFKKSYDVIWLQWCLENVLDKDLIKFLTDCRDSLTEKGVIIAKENAPEVQYVSKGVNKAIIRSDSKLQEAYEKAGLQIVKQFFNPDWPQRFTPLSVYVLKRK